MRQSGFTLVELIVVMMIVGILAVAAIPRFFQQQTFEARGYHDQVLAMVRYAQKAAIAQRTSVFVNADGGSDTVCLTYVSDPGCTNVVNVVINPADQSRFSRPAPDGVTLDGSDAFSFSALGRPEPNAAVVIGIVGDGITRTITVERETGYVHP
ncbi:MAG: hypothetical protein A3I66_08520 [Burkholderiales bacterium RIFCSPLOWO2_02_FULL_57_36]|nr:MAG: hypothetical protein A3I66_08520 [Burkholderiales bacterium RIFCSPLOWO2_02_FULL_57_36]